MKLTCHCGKKMVVCHKGYDQKGKFVLFKCPQCNKLKKVYTGNSIIRDWRFE